MRAVCDRPLSTHCGRSTSIDAREPRGDLDRPVVKADGRVKVFFAALAVDVVYQIVQLKWVYLGEALIIAQIVALVPYVLIRGLVNRIAGMLRR